MVTEKYLIRLDFDMTQWKTLSFAEFRTREAQLENDLLAAWSRYKNPSDSCLEWDHGTPASGPYIMGYLDHEEPARMLELELISIAVYRYQVKVVT